MQKCNHYIILISWILLSCNSVTDKSKLNGDTVTNTSTLKNDSTALLVITETHKFSDISKHDMFSLTLSGESILKGQILFKIVNSDNQIIYKKTFPAYDLLWDQADVITSVKLKEDTIVHRMKMFFAKINFSEPAIKLIPNFDPDSSEKGIWQDIKQDKTAIGFIYTHGYEGTYAIAYSKRSKKTVLYFSSD